MLIGSALCALLLTAWYWIFGIVVPASRAPMKVLLLDADPVLETMAHSPVFRGHRYQLFGPLEDPNTLSAAIKEHHPDYIVVQEAKRELPTTLLFSCVQGERRSRASRNSMNRPWNESPPGICVPRDFCSAS